MSCYFRLVIDPAVGDLRFLDTPRDSSDNETDIWAFTTCKEYPLRAAPLIVPIGQAGRAARFNFGAFDTPVVDPRMGALLKSLAPQDVQLIPAVADDGTELTILNVALVPHLWVMSGREAAGSNRRD